MRILISDDGSGVILRAEGGGEFLELRSICNRTGGSLSITDQSLCIGHGSFNNNHIELHLDEATIVY